MILLLLQIVFLCANRPAATCSIFNSIFYLVRQDHHHDLFLVSFKIFFHFFENLCRQTCLAQQSGWMASFPISIKDPCHLPIGKMVGLPTIPLNFLSEVVFIITG